MGARLRDESGIALIMALGIVLVLTTALATVLTFTAAGSRDASRVAAKQQAQALAEAGMNTALANLAAQYPSENKEGNGGGAPLAGGPLTYDAGTFTWEATFDATTEGWEVSGTGVVDNPTGPGATDIVQTATANISVVLGEPESKFGIYASDPSAACTELAGSITVNVPVYVASCLTTSGNTGSYPAKIWEPNDPASVSVHVGGVLTAGNNAKIGTPAKRIAWVSAGTNTNPGNVFALEYPTVPLKEELHVDAQAIYDEASWSSATCTLGSQPFDNDGVRNNSRGTVSLLTLASYNCTASNGGQLVWDSVTKRMEIHGTVFIDGNLRVANGQWMQYSGDGTIVFNGKVQIQGVLCGPGSTFNSSTGACSMQWDPITQGKMMIVAANAYYPPVLTYADPEADGSSNAWQPSIGTDRWALVDDALRQPTIPGNDLISSSSAGEQQDLAFASSLAYDPSATYRMWIYARPGNERGIDAQISTDDSTFGASQVLIAAGACSPCSAQWYSIDLPVSGTIGSQANLDGLRLRLTTTTSGVDSGATAAEVHAVYVARSLPTFDPNNAFVLDGSGPRVEVNTWTVGNFRAEAQSELGGAVLVEHGYARIAGGGLLKAYITLPSGGESLLYTLADRATDFR